MTSGHAAYDQRVFCERVLFLVRPDNVTLFSLFWPARRSLVTPPKTVDVLKVMLNDLQSSRLNLRSGNETELYILAKLW